MAVRETKVIYVSSGRLAAPAPVCPGCRKLLDGFTAVTSNSRQRSPRPRPGAVTICEYCLVFYKFHGTPLQVRPMSKDEVAEVHEELRALHRQMVINRALHPRGDEWLRRAN